jgi:hypothetical protein
MKNSVSINLIYSHALSFFDFDKTVHSEALKVLNLLRKYESNGEISLIAWSVVDHLPENSIFKDEIFLKLGSANVLAWLSYYIYDSIVDEGTNSQKIGLANLSMRFSLSLFKECADELGVSERVIYDHFNSVDVAFVKEPIGAIKNWDLEYCAQRSIGHILGVSMILASKNLSSVRTKSILKTYVTYIKLKQLLDDIRDFDEDLSDSRNSYVISLCKKNISSTSPNEEQVRVAFLEHGIDILHKDLIKLRAELKPHAEMKTFGQIIEPLIKSSLAVDLALKERMSAYFMMKQNTSEA